MTVAPDRSEIARASVWVKARCGLSAQSWRVFERTAPSAVCQLTSSLAAYSGSETSLISTVPSRFGNLSPLAGGSIR